MKYVLMLLGIAVLYTILSPVNTRTQKMKSVQKQKILAFGDSLTHGYGATAEESYPALLAKRLGVSVVNAGINGSTSADGLRRLSGLLNQHTDATVMILWFGGNDILQKRPLSSLKANLKQMITMTKERGIRVLLVSVPDLGIFGFSPLALYEEVADETDTALLSGVLGEILDQPKLKSDQIHPNAKGYSKIAEAIYTKLKEEGWL